MTADLMEFKGVSFKYPNGPVVLENISFKIRKGEFYGLVGPNGAGKSTLLKLMLGSLKPTKGEIIYHDLEITRYRKKGKIGYLSQEARNFNPQFPGTVSEVVQAQLAVFSRDKKKLQARVREALDQVGLLSKADQPIGKLSGGQQQRALLARTLAAEPEIVILDEPLTGIDVQSQRIIYDVLHHFNRHHGKTIIVVSHNLSLLVNSTARILLVDNGRVTFCDNTNLNDKLPVPVQGRQRSSDLKEAFF